MKIRKCSGCKKEKSLNKENFQVVKAFRKGFSFYCLDCNKELEKPKPKTKEKKYHKDTPRTVTRTLDFG